MLDVVSPVKVGIFQVFRTPSQERSARTIISRMSITQYLCLNLARMRGLCRM